MRHDLWHLINCPFRLSPKVERYLALITGLLIIAATCRVGFILHTIAVDLGIWIGPDDPYLLQFRPFTAWLWRSDPYGVVLMAWGLVGLVALGPFRKAAWHGRWWPTMVWGCGLLVLCGVYALAGLDLMLMPLGGIGRP